MPDSQRLRVVAVVHPDETYRKKERANEQNSFLQVKLWLFPLLKLRNGSNKVGFSTLGRPVI